MAQWLFRGDPDLVVDPGCGSGSLLIAASYERTATTHLLGLDVDPLAIAMAESNRGLRAIERLEFRRADFLLDDMPERPNAVICNPP